ncbi:Oxoglutarate/iron-dependent dioxygenase [Sesbania bispinosa]|nr:Oxoglutarate/iron-dependent dioxygenase [Sesbania bispinosa]
MASASTILSTEPLKVHASDISSIKAFAESNGASPIPSTYHSLTESPEDVAEELAANSIPVIDFSLLTSHDSQIHARAVLELGKACSEWSFFMLTNHGIPENLMEEMTKKSHEFHDLPVEEKEEFCDKGPLAPIKYSTSFDPQVEKVHYWRDYLKAITFPELNFPNKPPGYRENAFEYSQKIRSLARKLLQGISESLGLESNSIIESTGFDSSLQFLLANLYPPCPQPHLALGMFPHSDHGLLTFLTQNGIGGLQVKHDGKWVNVNPLPKCLVVNIGDLLEVVSNGRYASVLHRAVLNNRDTRISVVVVNGPAQDKEIGPAPELLEKEKPLFKRFKYKDYLQVQQKTGFVAKSGLDHIRFSAQQ